MDVIESSIDYTARREAMALEYAEINSNFRALSDIRFKLLAFLPVAAVATAVVSGRQQETTPFLEGRTAVLCVFGLLITAGLASYSARNDQIYVWLVGRAVWIERELGLVDSAFAGRPDAWLELGNSRVHWKVGHVSGVAIIYYSSAALFLLGFAVSVARAAWLPHQPPVWIYFAASAMTVASLGALAWLIDRAKRRRGKQIFENIDKALPLLRDGFPTDRDQRLALIDACAEIASTNPADSTIRSDLVRRVDHYREREAIAIPGAQVTARRPDVDDEAVFRLSLLVDLPVQWLAEVPQRRQGPIPRRPR